ncbi:fatty acid desaturase [Pseudoalteromonas luteoviolacea]|uniref:fatty acid desaturase n=1 Tax=Pseudoalteromonas luteoviolacea TaxID=43657 RepID=UPI00114E5929|nr:fatty acid desaturase [Pseudoalteromonas luteoviolacea]TQF66846.1 fatty acid desaturase [Pseudoalteromonas luteoviolacea]
MSKSTAKQNIKAIVAAINAEEKSLRARYSILEQQNSIAMVIMLLSLCSLIGVATFYYFAVIPAWLCIILAAFITSIAHELEHDLLHKQYFSKRPFIHNCMMLAVWLMRPNTVNPWYRRKIHLHHHKVSGTSQDIEERLVGNGIQSPFLRAVVIADGLLGLLINSKRFSKEIRGFKFSQVFNAGVPLATAYFGILYGVIAYYALQFVQPFALPQWGTELLAVAEFVMVVLIVPNIIRSMSLNLITSSMHYYGGVSNVLEQTHVLTSRWLLPFQLFCFDFGRTHTIHHFVPNQPFYIRQLISKKIRPIMAQHGVRFDDLHSLKHANQYIAKKE